MAGTKIKAINNVLSRAVKDNLRLSTSEAPKYINHVKEEVIYKKIGELNSWYTRILGLDEVRIYQERVVLLQEKLLSVQERRRSVGQQLSEIRKKSNDLQDQLHKVKRQDDLQRFLDLMREETEILKVERDISNQFNDCDREEREVFTVFTNAVKDSHEKQRAQLEYTKYFGLILSLVGSFLTFCYSTLKKQDLKRFVEEHLTMATGSSELLLRQLQDNQQQLSRVIKYIDSENPQVINILRKQHKELVDILQYSRNTDVQQMSNTLNSTSHGRPFSDSFNLSEVPDQQKLILYGCGILVGLIILRAFIS